jgi:tetratricopeptide (TPR) repeat protein
MTWLSHMLDYELYGDHPKGHLLTNVLLHITNALLLFMVLFRLTGAIWQSAFVAVLFALHPLNVGSVAWASERKNVLSTLFWLLTMWVYISYVNKPSIKKYGWVALFLALGLMSKPMLVTLPFVLLLLDYWPLRRWNIKNTNGSIEQTTNSVSLSRLILEKIPLLLLVIGSIVTTLIVQKMGGAVKSFDVLPLKERFINTLVSYLSYLQKMVWPSNLSIFYPHPEGALPVWKGVLCGMVLVGITILAVKWIRKAPYFAVGWFWYLGTLVPVIGIVQVGEQAMADRYAYVPLIGIFIILAWGISGLLEKWDPRKKVLPIAAGAVILVLMVVSWVQVGQWKNSITLFKHAISVTENQYPSFASAYDNLGYALAKKGDIGAAITHYKTAIKINPNYANPYNNLGAVLAQQGSLKEAITHYKTAIKIDPNFAKAYNNLGHALGKKGEIGAAITHYKTAIKINPNFAIAYDNLGIALGKKGEIGAAITHYRTAIKINPNSAETYNNLGTGLAQQGSLKEAINYFQEALRLKPNLISARNNLEMAIREYGQAGESK